MAPCSFVGEAVNEHGSLFHRGRIVHKRFTHEEIGSICSMKTMFKSPQLHGYFPHVQNNISRDYKYYWLPSPPVPKMFTLLLLFDIFSLALRCPKLGAGSPVPHETIATSYLLMNDPSHQTPVPKNDLGPKSQCFLQVKTDLNYFGFNKKSKWVWSGNTSITNRRQPHGTKTLFFASLKPILNLSLP